MRLSIRATMWPLALGVALALMLPSTAWAGPRPPLGHSGRWITDATGRVVVMHGTNMVYKLAPYYPAAAGFGDSDAAFLSRIGFNAVRVGVIWKALEPQPGIYDDAYLNQIAATVNLLARHGIFSLLDFHQDMYNEEFQGEGFPDWAVLDDGLPNLPLVGFPDNYFFNPALQRAFENFWADKLGPGGVGLQERYAAAWQHVALRFRANKSVLGYELMNEPFPGSDYLSCGSQGGCPLSDTELTSLERKVDKAVRSVDPRTLIFYEPYISYTFGFDDRLGELGDPRAVLAWHDYCLSGGDSGCPGEAGAMENANRLVSENGDGTFMTEYGATSDPVVLERLVSLADQNMVPWTEWAYCSCGDPTGVSDEGMVLDPREPKTASNLRASIVNSLVEPYPQVVAGTPSSWGYDRPTNSFQLQYKTEHPSGSGSFPAGSVSEIAAPAYVYGSRYSVRVDGGAIVSPPGASTLEIASCADASHVAVSISPGTARHATCWARLHLRVLRRRARGNGAITYRFVVSARLGSFSITVDDAKIVFAGHTVRTGRHGRATVVVRAGHRLFPYLARVSAVGYEGSRRLFAA